MRQIVAPGKPAAPADQSQYTPNQGIGIHFSNRFAKPVCAHLKSTHAAIKPGRAAQTNQALRNPAPAGGALLTFTHIFWLYIFLRIIGTDHDLTFTNKHVAL